MREAAMWIGLARFSALQRAEIAEIIDNQITVPITYHVSVLFNEPKLLKLIAPEMRALSVFCFSALQRAEIAEMAAFKARDVGVATFQCSSTSRNC